MNTLKAMQTFVAVARKGSFLEAAKALGMSTSSISRLMIEFEETLGIQLLKRDTRNVTVTSYGLQYLPRCEAILEQTESLFRDAHSLNTVPHGTLNVAGASQTVLHYIRPHLAEFNRTYPDVSIYFQLSTQSINLVEKGIDVAFRFSAMPDSALIARKCIEMNLKLCCSPAFIAQYGKPASLDSLPGYPCLLDMTGRKEKRWPVTKQLNLHGPILANDGELIRQMALDGLGITFLPEIFVNEDIQQGRLIELFPEEVHEKIAGYMVYPANAQITSAARAFIDFFTERLKGTAY